MALECGDSQAQGGVLPVESGVDSDCFQRLKPKYDKLRSSVAFHLSLGPYSKPAAAPKPPPAPDPNKLDPIHKVTENKLWAGPHTASPFQS